MTNLTLKTPAAEAAATFEELKARLLGQALCPDDAAYEEARLAWNRAIDQRPAFIVQAEQAGDVVEAVRFARRLGLGLAVQSTGHGLSIPANGGVLVLTSKMKGIQIDPLAATARIEAGLKWGEVLAAAQRFGQAPLLGSSPEVGVVGYTLGGGLGWLGRKYGLAADSVLSFELVDPDGSLVRASREENPDLFWGLRGGGGSFGIVTAMLIRLYPVSTVYGGSLHYPAEMAAEVMRHYRKWIANAPDELTSSIVLMNYPPAPHMPEILRGKSFVVVRGCFAGPVDEGRAQLEHWRGWRAPLIDDFKPMPFSQVARISNDPVNPMPVKSSGAWLHELSDEAIDTLIRFGLPQGGPPALAFVEVRHAGGAIGRVDPHASAFGHRQAPLVLFAIGVVPTPEAHALVTDYTERMLASLKPVLTGGVYLNFVDGEESRRRTADGYPPENFQRLQALKARTDPDNLIRFGFDFRTRR